MSWTRQETKYIIENAGLLTDEQLTIALNDIFENNRNKAAVRKQRQRLGIEKANGRGRCQVTKMVGRSAALNDLEEFRKSEKESRKESRKEDIEEKGT